VELAVFVAPIAPEPFVPDVSTPAKLTTVMDDPTACESVAVTATLLRGEVANARQISELPDCALLLVTRAQVRPAPLTPVTVVFVPLK
jgi:methylglyoxal synthase